MSSVHRSASTGKLDCDPETYQCYKDASRFVSRSVSMTMKRDASNVPQIYFCGENRRHLEECAKALRKSHPSMAHLIHVEVCEDKG